MKKFIFIMVAMLAMAVSATAQQKNYSGSSDFTDNWSVGVNGGVQTNLHDWNAPQGAVVGGELNKQLTPLFGLTFEGQVGFNNRMNWYDNSNHIHNGTIVDQASALVDGRFNLMNAFAKYNGTPRLFEVDVLAGVGFGHGFASSGSGVYDKNAILTKTGLNFNFNVGKYKAWTLTVRPAVLWNISKTGKFDSRYAVGQLTAGVVYHFKTKNKTHHQDICVPVIVEKPVEKFVDRVVEKKVVVEKVVTNNKVENVDNCWKVNFAQGSSEITSDVTAIAKEINKSNGVYKISGFTSPEGSETVNKELGLARANALKDALVKAGVDSSRIEIENDYEFLRTATIKLK